MPDHNFSQFAVKKAYEISYALFRVAGILKNEGLAKQLEDQALRVLRTASLKDYKECGLVLSSTEYLLRLGIDVNLLNPANGFLIINEISNLESAIAEFEDSAKLPDLNLELVFSKKPVPVDNLPTTPIRGEVKPKIKKEQKEEANEVNEETGNIEKSSINPAIRQSAILEKIRQSGNCRLKDIQEFLPDVSERTLRYDLQSLVDQGFIERVGTAGPSTHYQIKGLA